jgi:hypothetical protein
MVLFFEQVKEILKINQVVTKPCPAKTTYIALLPISNFA